MRETRHVLGVRVLGPVELLRGGVPQPLDRIQVRRLLSLLVSSRGRRWTPDELIDELWYEQLPEKPTAALQTVVTRLRGALGDRSAALSRNGATYLLELPDAAVDAWRLEAAVTELRTGTDDEVALRRLDGVLAAWRGVPFVDTPGPPELEIVAERLDTVRWEAEELRAIAAVRIQAYGRAIASALPLVLERPTRESLARVVAGALALEGRSADALELLAGVRAALESELGVAPSPATRATEGAIREGVAPLPDLVDARHGPVHMTIATRRPRDPHALVGRDAPLAMIDGALARTADAPGHLVLVSGDAGIGKSALLAASLDDLDVTVLRGECLPPEDDGPLLQLAERAHGRGDAVVRARDALDAIGARTDRPLVVALDDVQWAGPVTLTALRMFARRPLPGVTIVAAHRPPEPDSSPTLSETLAALLRERDVVAIELTPLEAAALAQLPQLRALPQARRARVGALLERLTAGNAFLATTLVEHAASSDFDLESGFPAALEHTLFARLAKVGPTAQRVLEIASIDAAGMDFAVLGAIAELDPLDLSDAVREARRAGLVREGRGDRLLFDHDLTRLGLLARLDEYEIRTLHARAAAALNTGPETAVERALHVADAGTCVAEDDAVAILVHGAEEALSTGRFEVSAQLFAEVTRRNRDFDLRLRHAVALEAAGRRSRALAMYDELIDEALDIDDRTAAARVALGGSLHGGIVGGDPERIRRLERSLDRPPADDALHLRVVAALVRELAIADRHVPPTMVRRAKKLLPDDETGAAMHAAIDAVTLAAHPATPQSLAKARRLAIAGARSGERELVLRGLELYAILQLMRGDYESAWDSVQELEDAVDAFPLPRYRWTAGLLRALFIDLRAGHEVADEPMRDALTLGSDLEIHDAFNAYSMFLLSSAIRRRHVDELEPAINAVVNSARCIPAWHAVHSTAFAQGGRLAEARASLEKFRDQCDVGLLRFPDIAYAFAAETALSLDDPDWCMWIAQRIERWSGRLILAGAGAACYGPTDLVIARLRLHVGDEAGGHAALARARALVDSPYSTAWRVIVDAVSVGRRYTSTPTGISAT